jgi:hypothetical protein
VNEQQYEKNMAQPTSIFNYLRAENPHLINTFTSLGTFVSQISCPSAGRTPFG